MIDRLKQKDLMIGDTVMYDPNVFIEDEYEPYHSHKVVTIDCVEDIESAFEGCYHDITLTDEILQASGFPKIYDGQCYYFPIRGAVRDSELVLQDDHTYCYRERGHLILNMKIHTVRELQHFLRTINIEWSYKGKE